GRAGADSDQQDERHRSPDQHPVRVAAAVVGAAQAASDCESGPDATGSGRRVAWADGRSPLNMPGERRADRLTPAPARPAAHTVACAPMAAATGPVTANEMGSSRIEISQSRLDTRPSIDAGTSRCFSVTHTIVPAVSIALNTRLAAISCHGACARP